MTATPETAGAPPRRRTTTAPATDLVRLAVDGLLDKKGLDVRVLDLRGLGSVSDFFVLATGESDLQVRAMVEAVRAGVQEATGERPWHVEGTDHFQWVVVDYVDVAVHVFLPEKRAFYNLERLWGDAPSEVVPETGSGATVALLDAPPPAPAGPALPDAPLDPDADASADAADGPAA